MTDFLRIFAMLVIAHALCDYPLQGDFLAKAKNHTAPIPGVPWGWAMGAHCAIHAGAVWFVTGSWVCALVEFLCHWGTDFAKCAGAASFSEDQGLHVFAKFWIAAAAIAGAP